MRHKEAPTLKTERLILRAYQRADFEAIYAISADPKITQYMGGPIESRTIAWEKFLRGPAMWQLLGYGMWIVQRRVDGAVLGQVGYADFMRDIHPPLKNVPEMAWMLGRDARGHEGRGLGYGSEALLAVLAWGEEYLDYNRYQCIISHKNLPSIALAQKFDFQETGRTDYKDDKVIIFEREAAHNVQYE